MMTAMRSRFGILLLLALAAILLALLAVACEDGSGREREGRERAADEPGSSVGFLSAFQERTPAIEPTATGDGDAPEAEPVVAASFTSDDGEVISVGGFHNCGVNVYGSVECWGNNDYGQATPPAGQFTSVSAGLYHSCGVKIDGSVECWGQNNSWHGVVTPPTGKFATVSAGWSHSCGVKVDGSVECWGWNGDGQATPPAGEFASVIAGGSHTCGVRRGNSVECWGNNVYGAATPPSGKFVSVSAGWSHTCGMKVDGAAECWGGDHHHGITDGIYWTGQWVGEFVSVDAGAHHNCGVKIDGPIECWGWNINGESTPPAGRFISVSAGEYHACGTRKDGSVECWGNNDYGQATPPGELFATAIARQPAVTPEPGSTGTPGGGGHPGVVPTRTPTAPTLTPEPTPVADTPVETGLAAMDREALVELYKIAGGSAWTWGSGCSRWEVDDDSASVGGWCGVTVDSRGRVTGLELAGVNLDNHYRLGWSPLGNWRNLSVLGDLTALSHLDLSGNDLGGVLPAELDQLTRLTHLNLSGNAFQGDIADRISGRDRDIAWENLKNLVELDLSNNRRCELIGDGPLSTCNHGLSGWIPAGIPYLPNLSVLNLSGNQLTGGAKSLLDNGFVGNAGAADATIEIDLSDNPWNLEPAEHRDYWNEFKVEMTRGFVDMAVLLDSQFSDYPQLDADSVRDYAASEGLERIEVRATKHLKTGSSKYARTATWIIRGAKVVGGAGNVVGWVAFSVEGAEIASRMLEAGVAFLEDGPGQVIRDAQDKYLGAWQSCLNQNNFHINAKQAEAACAHLK